jgi:hypothetical protein
MNKILSTIALTAFILLSNFSSAQDVKVTSGKVQRFENFKSKLIGARNVDL